VISDASAHKTLLEAEIPLQGDLLRSVLTARVATVREVMRAATEKAPTDWVVTGCGDSLFAGMCAEYWFAELDRLPLRAIHALAFSRYLYRAVDKNGKTVDFYLSRKRDVNAAKGFLRSAMKNTRRPTKITLDAYAASHRAVREMKEEGELPRRVTVRSSQYLNNLIEQDHRRVKHRIGPMLGFKRFANAAVVIAGIELAEKIKKNQFQTGKLGGATATAPEIWRAALAA